MAEDEHRLVPTSWRPLSPVVVKAPVKGKTASITLRVVQFGASRMVSRALVEDTVSWSEARLVMEHQCQRELVRMMDQLGFIPFGPQEWAVVEDLVEWESVLTLTQTAVESTSPVWIAVRQALDEDRADRARAAR